MWMRCLSCMSLALGYAYDFYDCCHCHCRRRRGKGKHTAAAAAGKENSQKKENYQEILNGFAVVKLLISPLVDVDVYLGMCMGMVLRAACSLSVRLFYTIDISIYITLNTIQRENCSR